MIRQMPEDSDLLCEGWAWDPVLRELRKYPRRRKGIVGRSGPDWQEEPEAVERLLPVESVALHFWSQPPMQTSTGQTMSSQQARVVAKYESGAKLEINEDVRSCAEALARAIAGAYELEVVREGAPGGRRSGNLPSRDELGRLVSDDGKTRVVLDPPANEIIVSARRFPFGSRKRRHMLSELRRLELTYEPKPPVEVFTVWAIVGYDEQRVPIARYEGYEGWADPEEWRVFAADLGREFGVEVLVSG
jgi:hypothetical protein